MEQNQNGRPDLPKRPSRVHDIPGAADPFKAEEKIRSAAKAARPAAAKNGAKGRKEQKRRAASRPISPKAQQEKKNRKKVLHARALLFLASFVFLLLLSVGVFFLNLHHYEKPGFSYYTVKIGDVKKGSSVAYKKMMRNGTLYVNLTPVLELCDIVTTGDTNELRFTTDVATDENILFRIGTREVECNGVPEHLEAPSILENGDVYVPYDFLATYVKGLSCSFDEKTHTVEIRRNTTDDGQDYLPVTFLLKGNQPMQGVDEAANFPDSNAMGLLADVSAYEEYMNPTNRDDFLTIASVEHPMDSSFEPQNLTQVVYLKADGRPLQYMVDTAEKASEALFAELRANGFSDVGITVGYVSYSFQNYYYTHRKDGESIDAPGTNDTVLGLSFKIDYKESVENFDATDAGKWLSENSWKFGFVKRYPSDKTAQTGYGYVANQYRFVGRYHAMRMHTSGQCLEEYVAYLQSTGYLPTDDTAQTE